MRIDSRKPKAAALSAALTVALLAGAGATDAHAATLSDTVGSTPSEATLVQPVDYRGDGYGSMQEWNASMGAKRDSLEMRAQITMNMYGDYATDCMATMLPMTSALCCRVASTVRVAC